MTKLNQYRHPAKGLNETQMEIVVSNLRDIDESEVGMYTYDVLESLTSQIIEAEDGLDESSLEYKTMKERQQEWREMECENSVRVNGCEDSAPYYDVPWIEGPIPVVYTERWCSSCIEDFPNVRVEDGEVIAEFPEDSSVELDYMTGTEAENYTNVATHNLERGEDGGLNKVKNDS